MDQTALFTISYGLYILGAKEGDKLNACITNTGMQVTAIPEQISVTVAKSNLTHDMIMASGQFSLTPLTADNIIENVKRFGMQSGREVDKFEGIHYELDTLGNPYVVEGAAAVITGKVNKTVDVGTHTIFIADVVDAKTFKQNESITYGQYREIKANGMQVMNNKQVADHKEVNHKPVYECTVCHYEYEGDIPFEELPDDYVCPICKQPKSVFKMQ